LESDSVHLALTKATATRERLAAEVQQRTVQRRVLVEGLTAQRARLQKKKLELEAKNATVLARVQTVEQGNKAALALAIRFRKAVQVLIRLAFGVVAVLAMLAFFTTDQATGLLVLACIALEIGSVWFLTDLADRAELTGE
jgi:hypothetical protein